MDASALTRGERAVGERLEREFERTLILRALAIRPKIHGCHPRFQSR